MKTDHQPIVIFGGTGHYGSRIVHHLLEKNEKVRVLSRNAQQAKLKLGKTMDIIEGDVTCRQVVDRALTGGKAVVICLSAMNPKSIKRLKRIERDGVLTIMEAAQKAGIRRLVYLSGYEIRAEVLEALNTFQFGAIKLDLGLTVHRDKN